MNFPLSYCPDGKYVLSRLLSLYEDRSEEIILAKMNTPSIVMREFASVNEKGFCTYPDMHERVKFWDALLKEHTSIHDDSIPNAYLSELDQGLYGGLFNGDVRFMCDNDTGWVSSMVPPIIKDWSEFDGLSFSKNHEWFSKYLNQLDIFVNSSNGKFGISHFILINGLNFVFELLGATETYMSLDEHPEMIKKASDLAHKVNLEVHKTFFEKVPLIEGGTCSNFAQWIPGKIISESVDPFHMTSVEYFEKWGRGPVEKIFSQFDGGVIHIHGNGRHLLEAASSLKGLKVILVTDDLGYAPSLEVIADIKKKVGNIPIVCYVAEFSKFYDALKEHRLPGGVFYNVVNVPDIDTANRCMELVRNYKA